MFVVLFVIIVLNIYQESTSYGQVIVRHPA